uniref:Uncharacterized protein n=1 Tax=Tolypothrix bouteillei VB521301 TaxID=1479485 RepID=A0A0C1N2Z1_9CYAN
MFFQTKSSLGLNLSKCKQDDGFAFPDNLDEKSEVGLALPTLRLLLTSSKIFKIFFALAKLT